MHRDLRGPGAVAFGQVRGMGKITVTGSADADPVDIPVVVVTYSPGPALARLLDSLPAAGAAPDTPVVLADNGSTDGSVEAAAERANVQLLRMGSNRGYGSAANAGVATLPADAPWVLVVNPDVVLGVDSLRLLLAAAGRHPRAAAVGPLITTEDGVVYPSARQLPSIADGVGHAAFGWCWPNNPWTRRYRLDHQAPTERTAGWLSGACLLLRRSAFDAVGGFDPDYFMYFEDVDLGDRLGRAGWDSVYAPSAAVVHTGGHATRRDPRRMVAAHHASAYRYLSRRYDRPWQLPLRWVLRAGLSVRTAIAVRSESVAAGAPIPQEVRVRSAPEGDR
jgi:N-acetylglucosaminyl-diphospho-decaprenol L-rhamnosyltransferase